MTHLERLFAALYVSEGWYSLWVSSGRLHRKARAMVIYDRMLTISCSTPAQRPVQQPQHRNHAKGKARQQQAGAQAEGYPGHCEIQENG